MSGFEFKQVKRESIPLFLGVAGGTGSGKTFSALLLARGIAGGQPFAFIDTENGRAKHYADLFPEMRHGEIHAPFRPGKYADAIAAGADQFPVVVVDSMSHEWAGDGGCLDWHDDLMGGNQSKNLSAWIEPKKAHKALVTRLLQVNAHVIACFRAEPKVEAVRKDGKVEIVPKASLTGLDGWLPISEKMLPYELTASFLLMADAPGVPKPIKLQEQHRGLVPLEKPLGEEVGRALAAWAAGSAGEPRESGANSPGDPDVAEGTLRPESASPAELATADERKLLTKLAGEKGLSKAQAQELLREVAGVSSTAELPREAVSRVFDAIAAYGEQEVLV
jgi:AAA domain